MAEAPVFDRRQTVADRQYLTRAQRAYKKAFGGMDGKAALADIAAFAKVMEPTYVIGDSHQTAFNEGMRSVALRIYSMLSLTPDDAVKIADSWQRKQYDNILEADDE